MIDLNVGDVVFLKSGGPAMTVNKIFEERGNVECVWFDDNKRSESIFAKNTVSKDKPAPVKKDLIHGIKL